jgi:hypothetical protein
VPAAGDTAAVVAAPADTTAGATADEVRADTSVNEEVSARSLSGRSFNVFVSFLGHPLSARDAHAACCFVCVSLVALSG